MKIILYVIGIILLGVSIYTRYWRGKRIFERRNAAGIQGFNSYNDALKKTYYENFIHFLGVFAFFIGLLMILFAYFLYDDIMAHI